MAKVINKTTLQLIPSVYLPDYDENDWIHNPDLSSVQDVPKKYWKIVGTSVMEMTQAEKTTADDSLEYLDKYGYQSKDYKYVRNKMITYITNAGGFTNLNTVEKEIAVRYFCVVKSDRDTVYTTAQQIQLGKVYYLNSVTSRQARMTAAMMEIYNKLSKTDADVVLDDVVDNLLDVKYATYGREGTLEGDPEGLFDYIEARSGTAYVSTGLAAKGYTPTDGTLQDLVDACMNILKSGEY